MDDHGAHHYPAHATPDSEEQLDDDVLTLTDPDEKGESEEEDEVLDGIEDERDVEKRPTRLERVKSARSVKDPNLVCIPRYFSVDGPWLLTILGHVGRSRRPRKPEELDHKETLGSNHHSVRVHVHIARFIIHGRTSVTRYFQPIEHHNLY